mmetsp:Transcript_111159/g.321319  ORF Transcript_111159/g.321319 Transcript_111159/m.321319 type:complete len:237 (-) Transcript_111159:174-884(-)
MLRAAGPPRDLPHVGPARVGRLVGGTRLRVLPRCGALVRRLRLVRHGALLFIGAHARELAWRGQRPRGGDASLQNRRGVGERACARLPFSAIRLRSRVMVGQLEQVLGQDVFLGAHRERLLDIAEVGHRVLEAFSFERRGEVVVQHGGRGNGGLAQRVQPRAGLCQRDVGNAEPLGHCTGRDEPLALPRGSRPQAVREGAVEARARGRAVARRAHAPARPHGGADLGGVSRRMLHR